MEAQMITPSRAIKDVIVTKVSRSGERDLAYGVAVNALRVFVDRDDMEQAVFGNQQLFITSILEERYPHTYRWSRARDGGLCRTTPVFTLSWLCGK
jgi:hypothetical protein